MLPAPFSVSFDYTQTRVQTHPKVAQAWGMGWNGPVYQDTWIDPVTETLMLRPMCVYPDWVTSNSGIFAKLTTSDFTFGDSSKWKPDEKFPGAGTFISAMSAGDWIRTATAPGKNRGMHVAYYNYGAGEQVTLLYSAGWHATDRTVTGSHTAYELYSDGTVLVYRGGYLVGQGKVGVPQADLAHLLVIPMRKREILFMTVDAQGFTVVCDDIEEDAATYEITPNAKFWLVPSPSATSVQLQIAPFKFKSTGFATSELITFSKAPDTGEDLLAWANPVFSTITTANLYGDKSGSGTDNVSSVSLVESDGSTAFVPDGSLSVCRLYIGLSGDGSYTSFIRGGYAEFPGTTATTNASEQSAPDAYMTGLTFEVPDDAFNAKFTATYKEPNTVAGIVPKLREVSSRPAKLTVNTAPLMDGRTRPTKYKRQLTGEVSSCVVECRDMTAALDEHTYRDDYVLDGYDLCRPVGDGYSAVRKVLEDAGIATADLNLSDANFLIPEVPGQKSGEFSFAIRSGETARRVLDRLHQEFSADWFMGPRPTATGVQFCFLKEADLPSVVALTLYASTDDAIAGGKERWQVYRTYDDETEEIDANEVFASGYDCRKGEVVQAFARDESSIDATTLPSLRPDNWVGNPRVFGVTDPRLRTYEACAKVVDQLVPVVGSRRIFGDFEAPCMIWYTDGDENILPLWRGDLVTLDGVGDTRVTSLSVTAIRNSEDVMVQDAKYTFGGFTHAGGTSVREIRARNRERMSRRGHTFDFENLMGVSVGRYSRTRRTVV